MISVWCISCIRSAVESMFFSLMSLSILNSLRREPSLFKGKKVIAIGDCAVDQSFRCYIPKPGLHATHAGEENLDVEPNGEELGVGGVNAVCKFIRSFEVEAFAITAVGSDPEGVLARQIMEAEHPRNRCFMLAGVQSVTRLRFFVKNSNKGDYGLRYRVNKEPQIALSIQQVEAMLAENSFLSWFYDELLTTDAMILNDFEKGFFSAAGITSIGAVIRKANVARARIKKPPIIVIVDPKFEWSKFKNLPTTVLKPNHREAATAVGLDQLANHDTIDNHSELLTLATQVAQQYSPIFPKIFITLGHNGALLLTTEQSHTHVYKYSAVEAPASPFAVATHCGDVFDASLALGYTISSSDDDVGSFANAVSSLQFAMLTSHIVDRQTLLQPINIAHITSHQGLSERIASLPVIQIRHKDSALGARRERATRRSKKSVRDLIAWAGHPHVTLALVFTDVAGSTALATTLGNEKMNVLRRRHFAAARRAIQHHNGYEVKNEGDAFMAVFRTSVAAVDFALRLSRKTGDQRIHIRAGIHVGPVQIDEDEGDIFGAMINFAARVVGNAKGPEIWISDKVKAELDEEKAQAHAALEWIEHPPTAMKGFEGDHRLWSLASV